MKDIKDIPLKLVRVAEFAHVRAALKTKHAVKLLDAAKSCVEDNEPGVDTFDVYRVLALVDSMRLGHIREIGALVIWMTMQNVVIKF